MGISVDTFFLELNGQGTLQAQIQQMIAEGILSGRFHVGEKLPSSRKLAAHLGVSRITVTLAYTELLANDYLTAKGRSGYFVSQNAPVPPKYSPVQKRDENVDWDTALARRFSDGDVLPKPSNWRDYKYPFIYGQADRKLFDHANWRLCAVRALGHKDFASLTGDYMDQDDPLLIEFIARHTLPRRGIAARPEEILITMGAQNALWLASRILLNRNRTAVIEDPCYYALRDLLNHSDCKVSPLAVDRDGLTPDALPDETDVIFTTPSHQSPTTATMPVDRRHELLKRARELDAMVVEDDYEFEMAFLGSPSPALKSMDRDGRVIYVGSFSKSLFPGLRLGYIVGSEPFIREARALRSLVLRHPPGHIQRTAAYFLSLGHYDAQIRRMSKTLARRREALDSAVEQYGLTVAGRGIMGGSSLWMSAPDRVDTTKLAKKLQSQGVHIEPGASFFNGLHQPRNFYRLGYSSIGRDRIGPGVKLIADAIRSA
ncbi:PLP-dependent aminotransferase family protein [Ruegeria atlantica]|uniref:HTH-type transcriptional regulatory protein GabR n=1 Tax=Ruegeria atlantica TaxID=81569 RepID=A0A0P1E3G1_9RHOB|nr:PLP-dependent aminotransferase family protein [Ruegeria atlantica]CUH42451.1 HTH-type transcriptional regulatory protein GabR [Ruegeria atlantica]CUH50509.1 HTH-type transcriptional regulatory protein GabR [Ruegeria atlantica]